MLTTNDICPPAQRRSGGGRGLLAREPLEDNSCAFVDSKIPDCVGVAAEGGCRGEAAAEHLMVRSEMEELIVGACDGDAVRTELRAPRLWPASCACFCGGAGVLRS